MPSFVFARTAVTAALTIAGWLGPAVPAQAQKTDVVTLLNGDRVTCEMQKLDRGKLTVKTDGIGTIAIEWDDIDRVTSTASYELELMSGERMEGSLTGGDTRTVDVQTAAGLQRLSLDAIVRISRLGRTFWRRLDGSISAGFSFTQANVQTQWTFDTAVSYRSRTWVLELNANSLLTSSEDQDRQTRNNLSLQGQRFIRPRWSYVGWGIFQQNEELSLNLRTVAGGGILRVFRSNRTIVQGALGAAFTREEYAGEGDQSIAEAVAAAGWDWFTFDGRSTNLSTSLQTFYALNAGSRFRLELDTSFKSDIVGDLYWSVSAFESYNSRPPENEKKSDFGMSASLGWTF